jgi:hypothetical protein
MQASSFDEFWPYYLTQHAQPATRLLHVAGTLLALLLLLVAIATGRARYAMMAPVVAYALAWIGHGAIEHNHPATFEHPLWSLRADIRMCWLWLTGGLGDELQKAGVATR